MCILCEPKFKKANNGKEYIMSVANEIIYHPEGNGGTGSYEYTNVPGYECPDGGYWIENGNELRSAADDPYCGTGTLTINYCPLCGKKLEHKE